MTKFNINLNEKNYKNIYEFFESVKHRIIKFKTLPRDDKHRYERIYIELNSCKNKNL